MGRGLNGRYLAMEADGLMARCTKLAVRPDVEFHETH